MLLENGIMAVSRRHALAYHERVAALQFAKVIRADDDEGDTDIEIGPDDIQNGIALVNITGPMVSFYAPKNPWITSTTRLTSVINMLARDPSCKGLVIHVDSGGGMLSGSDDLYRAIRDFGKPTAAMVQCACSAAYYAIAGADKIYAAPLAEVGSLGTYCVLADTTKMLEQDGVKLTLVSSGPLKGAGADGSITEPLVSMEQRLIDVATDQFKSDVVAGRGAAVGEMFTGGVWFAKEAEARPLCELGTMQDCLRHVAELASAREQFSAVLARTSGR